MYVLSRFSDALAFSIQNTGGAFLVAGGCTDGVFTDVDIVGVGAGGAGNGAVCSLVTPPPNNAPIVFGAFCGVNGEGAVSQSYAGAIFAFTSVFDGAAISLFGFDERDSTSFFLKEKFTGE